MPMNPALFWFPKLAEVVGPRHPFPNVDDPNLYQGDAGLNADLSALPFDANKAAVLAALQDHDRAFGAATLGGFNANSFAAWQKGELAQVKLRRMIREQNIPFPFDSRNNTADFIAQINDAAQLNQIRGLLLGGDHLGRIATRANQVDQAEDVCHFAAIVHAFSNDAMYAFTAEHKQQFLAALIAGVPGLIQAGIPVEDISNAIIGLLPFVRDAAQFQAIAAFYAAAALPAAAGPLNDERVNFNLQLRQNIPRLFEVGVTSANLTAQGVSLATLHPDIIANLQVGRMMTPAEFAAVVRELYAAGAGVLAAQANIDDINKRFADLATAAADVAAIVNLQRYSADVPNRMAFDNAVGARAGALVRAAASNEGLQAVAACLRASNKETDLREALLSQTVAAGITGAAVVAVHGDALAIVAQMEAMIDGTLAVMPVTARYVALQGAVALLTAAYGVGANTVALQAKLANPAFIAAALQAEITLEQIVAQHRIAQGLAAADAGVVSQFFQAFIAELAPAVPANPAQPGANIARIAEIQALIGNGPGRAFSQKAVFDAAVLAQANRLLTAATAADFNEVVRVLRTCATATDANAGQAAINAYINANIASLIARGIAVADIAAATGAPAALDASGVCALITAAVAAGTITAPADLLRAQAAIATADRPSVAAFRTALADSVKVTALFAAITPANYVQIQNLVHGGLGPVPAAAAGEPLRDAFFAKFDVAAVNTLLTRAANPLAINQIGELAKGHAYAHADAAAFRETHIKAALTDLKTYLDSVTPPQGNADWKHKDAAGAVVDTDPAAIQTRLAEFKQRLERFNDSAQPAAIYQAGMHAVGQYHGTHALQNFINSDALIAQKLSTIYGGNFTNVRREFANCDLNMGVQQTNLIAAVKAQVQEALKKPQTEVLTALQAIVPYISNIKASWHASTDTLRRNVAADAKEYLLDPNGTLLELLNNPAITDVQQIIALCNHLTPDQPIAATTLQVRLKDAVKQLVSVSPVDAEVAQARLAAVITACDKFPDLDKAAVVKEINDNFLKFVAVGLIAVVNYGAVKDFLNDPAAPMGNSLPEEVVRRRDAFFNDPRLVAGSVGREDIFKQLVLLRDANEVVTEGEFFTAVYGALDVAAEVGQLGRLLSAGVKLSEIVRVVGGDPVPSPEQLQAKVVAYFDQGITAIAAVVDDTQKARVKKDFSNLARAYQNAVDNLDETTQTTIKTLVRTQTVNLLRRGVSISDIRSINATVTVAELEQLIAVDPAMTPVQKEALLKEMRTDNVSTASPKSFFDSLPESYRRVILENFQKNQVPLTQQQVILAQAFRAIKSTFAAQIDEQGKLIPGNDTVDLWRAYKAAINEALPKVMRQSKTFQEDQGLAPLQLNNIQRSREALDRLAKQVGQIQDQGRRTKIQTIIQLLIKIDDLRKRASDTNSENAFDALELAKKELERYSDDDLDALTTLYVADRANLESLQVQANEKLIAIDMLIGSDNNAFFKDTLLADIGMWGNNRVKDAIASYSSNPAALLIAEFRAGFRNLIQTLGLTGKDAENFKRNLTDSISRAETATVNSIQQALSQRGVLGGEWFASSALHEQAQQLWLDRVELESAKLNIEAHLNESVDISELKGKVKELKTNIQTALAAKGDRAQFVGKKPVVFETAVPLVGGVPLTSENIRTLFDTGSATGVHVASLGSKNTAKPEDLGNHAYVVKLDGNHFTTVQVLQAEGASKKPIGVTIDTTKVTRVADAATGATAQIDVSRLDPNSEQFIDFAVQQGMLLAQAMIDVSENDTFAMFKGNSGRCLDISGNFKKPGAAGKFELAVMDVAIKMLNQREYTINKSSEPFNRFNKSIKDQKGRFVDHPKYKAAMDRISGQLDARQCGVNDLKKSAERMTQDLRNNFRP